MKKYKIFWKNSLRLLQKIPTSLAILCIYVYQKTVSPTTGILRVLPLYPRPSCVFYPTCSVYAKECFSKYSFITAFKKTTHRIARCHSGTDPQVDLP